MNRRVAVLRPEPGNSATAALAERLGFTALRLPLFAVQPVAWTPPNPADHDGLILSSANVVRLGGAGLAALRSLPVLAVGEATAVAARNAGFDVMAVGQSGADALLKGASAKGIRRALHLGARDRTIEANGPVSIAITVYASDPLPIERSGIATIDGSVALLHSARAARRLSNLADTFDLATATIRVAALSPAVAEAAGSGWADVAAATAPTDAALLGLAGRLFD